MYRTKERALLTLGCVTLMPLLFGCSGGLKRATSGQIGCPASEIEITEQSRGWGTFTWTAKCRGLTYYCSSAATGKSSSQYQCAQEAPTEAARQVEPAQVAPTQIAPERVAAAALPAFPDEALGFKFGATVEETSAACTALGHSWEAGESSFKCSGLAADIGVPAYSRLHFCEDKLCQLQAFATLEVDEVGEQNIHRVYDKLKAKYGKASMNQLTYPADCRGHFLHCVVSGDASWKARWKWPDGQIVYVTTGTKESKPTLGILYRIRDPKAPDLVKSEAF